ncbi:tetratricopeptide repeat protein [Propionivibrio sp.]|uniref:tetratricopeptide repeat protein n=1 Tax=Propionivibrio sp. TaxID=2212460 RepID=UPI003BF3F882
MKHLRRTLCFTTLSLVLGLPALAADQVLVATKRPAAVREAKRPLSTELRPGDARYADQPGQAVFQVLLAEIALQRGDAVLASTAYADLALRSRDPKVLERTVEVAGYARRFDLALEATRLWLEVEPTSKRAQQMMVSIMILSNQLDDLAPSLIRMLEVDKESLADNLLGLNRMFARNKDRQAVFSLIDKVCRPFFGVAEAHYAVAMAAGSAGGMSERALAEVRRALELRPDWEMAALLEAQLLAQESPAKAISFMQGFVERNPKARDVQLTLARALVGEKRYAEAKSHFDQLLVAYPDRPEVVYPAAILALQQDDRALAEVRFKHLVTLDIPDKSLAYYYLGQIVEEGKHSDEALAYYALVGPGEQYLPAQFRSAHVLAGQGKLDAARQQLSEAKVATPEERAQLLIAEAALLREAKQTEAAFALLEQALAAQPEQPDFLYESALMAEKLGRFEILESRLRKLIELRPESAQAYNALGYSYAERNIRLPEARELIEKALKLAPEDSFIVDSLGWVLYRQGDLPGALALLEQAYARRNDPEIAAHLGEVLWALGRKDDARRTLVEALKKYPDNEALADAVKKFVP